MSYREVPVDAAREISRRFDKDIVVILAWDVAHDRVHTTTYGAAPRLKQPAAQLGELVTRAVGCDVSQAVNFEDFRFRTQAEWAAEREKLLGRIKELEGRR